MIARKVLASDDRTKACSSRGKNSRTRAKVCWASETCIDPNTRCPVSAACSCCGHGFAVAQFSDHDTIGILADDEAQGLMVVGYVNADFALRDDRFLRMKNVLDGILDGDDVECMVLVEVVHDRRQGGALAGTGYAADQNQPVERLGNGSLVHVRKVKFLKTGNRAADPTNRGMKIARRAKYIETEAVASRSAEGKNPTPHAARTPAEAIPA